MSKKYLTPEDRAELDRLTRTSGVKGAAVGLAIGLGAAALTYRRSPHFRALTMPMQAILPASGKKSSRLVIKTHLNNMHLSIQRLVLDIYLLLIE